MKSVLPAIIFLSAGAASAATLAVDQVGADRVNGGYGSPAVQSFTPAFANIAGVDVYISGTAALFADVTASIFGDAGLTSLLVSDTIEDHPRMTTAEFRFDPVAVDPETLYYIRLDTGPLVSGVLVSDTLDPYPRGDVVQGGGNLGFRFKDLAFKTYYDPEFREDAAVVPLPAAGGLLVAALGMMAVARRRCRA